MKHLNLFEIMRHLKKFNYIGGIDGEWPKPDRDQFAEYRDKQDKFWITKTGDRVLVSKMSLKHLRNSLNAILDGRIDFENQDSKDKWAKIILDEILKR